MDTTEKIKALIKPDADLHGANLAGADLHGANLAGADLTDADLSGADLTGANLSGADIRHADLTGAGLRSANLRYANLRCADLTGTCLKFADLRCADIRHARLTDADLRCANLADAGLEDADLTDVRTDERTAFFAMQCPETGSFDAWKKCTSGGEPIIVRLRIPARAKRSSATSRKCRASEAKVLGFYDRYGNKLGIRAAYSTYDMGFIYKAGETVKPDKFDPVRWRECAPGIHFFMTFGEAVNY